MFRSAIVKKPCKNFSQGLTTSSLGFPDYEKVLEQHENYIKTLRKCGLEVHILDADEKYPDSTFVEDTAIVNEKCAVISCMSESSRKGEVVQVQNELLDFLKAAHAEGSPIVSTWMVGMPEIDFINDNSATAKWGFEHYSLIKPADMDLTMFAYYEDEYIKADGGWKICKTGYQRVIEQEASRKDNPNLKLNVG